jgi:hypothetical protein
MVFTVEEVALRNFDIPGHLPEAKLNLGSGVF